MKRTQLTVVSLAFAALALAINLLVTGCETEPVSSRIYITPSSATIHNSESIEFTAHGGYEYEWSVENPNLGLLSSARGVSTVYTSMFESSISNTAKQVISVKSYITGDSGSSNSAPAEWSTSAIIIHN